MNFDELFRSGMDAVKGVFGEVVTYVPASGDSFEVKALVDRDQMGEDATGIPVRVMTITVSGDAERGVPASSVDTYGDTILVDKIRGQEPQPVTILEVVTGSGNVTKMVCR